MSRRQRQLFSSLFFLQSAVLCQASFFSTYPVQWSSVPANGNTSPKNLTANCVCDTRQDVCVTGCCCAAACVNQVVAATTNAGQCLPAGPPDQTLDYCVSSSSVQKVNLPNNGDFYSVTIQAADNQFLDQLLCIQSSRNPNLGDFYPDPPVGNVDNNAALVGCPKPATPSTIPTSYLFNTPVFVTVNNQPKAPLTLPYPVFSQKCNDQFQVGFLTSVPDGSESQYVSCVRSTMSETNPAVSALSSLCTSGSMSIANYMSMGFFALPISTQSVPIIVSGISYMDPLTGTLTALSVSTATTFFNASSGICHDYVYAVDMLLAYNWQDGTAYGMAGTLSQVSVALIVTDVDTSSTWLKQMSRVVWAQYQPGDTRVFYSYSGNPGYLTGFPLLVGTQVKQAGSAGQQVAIQRYSSGMPLIGPVDDGLCSGAGQEPVRFGYDATSTCYVPMTGTMLANYCTGNATNPTLLLGQLIDGIMTTIGSNNLWFGVWGNSNTSQPSVEWVQVQISNWPPSPMVWNPTSQTCSNVVVGYDLQILTGVAFASNNLQSKVLYANLCLRTATWTFPASQSASTPAVFPMTSTVTFISKEQEMETDVQKPYPPLLAPLPEDIFYPFITTGASMHAVSGLLVTSLLAIAGMLFLIL